MPTIAVLLIAHGSRRPEANADAVAMAEEVARRGNYAVVEVAYLELAEPNIATGGARCVERGADGVILLPYFLSPGVHVREDLTAAQNELRARFPLVAFQLAEPLGGHPLLAEVVVARARAAQPALLPPPAAGS